MYLKKEGGVMCKCELRLGSFVGCCFQCFRGYDFHDVRFNFLFSLWLLGVIICSCFFEISFSSVCAGLTLYCQVV